MVNIHYYICFLHECNCKPELLLPVHMKVYRKPFLRHEKLHLEIMVFQYIFYIATTELLYTYNGTNVWKIYYTLKVSTPPYIKSQLPGLTAVFVHEPNEYNYNMLPQIITPRPHKRLMSVSIFMIIYYAYLLSPQGQ